MNQTLNLALDGVRIATETLAMVGLPACVVDGGGRALAANDLFAELTPRVVTRSGDRVYVENKTANELLLQSMEKLNTGAPKSFASIAVPATETLPALILQLVSTRYAPHNIFTGASGLIIATPLSKPSALSVALVAALFNLTRSEARVARGILEGKPVNRLTIDLGLSAATVRSYLKSVFAKTGVRRQAELVSLLAGARPLIR
jgi:DNA-binding CsgD family transcriptional regulator